MPRPRHLLSVSRDPRERAAQDAEEKAPPWLSRIKWRRLLCLVLATRAGSSLPQPQFPHLRKESKTPHCTVLPVGMAGIPPFLLSVLTLGTSPASCFSSWPSRVVFLERVCILMRASRSRRLRCSTLVYLEAAPTEEKEGTGTRADPGKQEPLTYLARHLLGPLLKCQSHIHKNAESRRKSAGLRALTLM